MASESSLNHSMDNAKRHYSSMFFLPSFNKTLLAVAIICIAGISLCAYVLFHSINSLILGISLFVVTFLMDLGTSKIVLKSDPIFSIRRTLVLSLAGWLLWLFFNALGVGLSSAFSSMIWVKLCLLGFAVVVTLRSLVIVATSTASKWRQVLSTLLQPALCLTLFLIFWIAYIDTLAWQMYIFVVASPIIGFMAVFLLLSSIDRLGKSTYSMPALSLFRAFILNWVSDQNAPLEKHLESMGQDTDIEVTLLKFDASKSKAAIIVPLVHPGPFKNVGSSLLPSLLKQGYEKEFDCDACVPLGILGHELDLASQAQNHKIVSQVIASARFESTVNLASPFVRETESFATASCQIFGDTVFLSFSLAPKTTEDLPQELGRIVSEEARKCGLKTAIIVNTHNSINDIVDTEEHLDLLQKVASKCLQKATAQPTKPFMVGAATVFPEEFTLKAGMGTGGITALVVQVENQKAVYIVIDGNNMVSGLREKLLASLAVMGFDESEVLTTDTHAVSGLEVGRQGYHPVGEAMDQELLTRYIGQVSKKAVSNLESCKAGCIQFVVPGVRVIGEENLRSITTLVDRAIVKAKRIVSPIFGIEGLVLILLLMLF